MKVEPPKPTPVPEKKPEAPAPTPSAPAPASPEPPTIKQFVKGDGYAGIKDVPNPKYEAPKTEAKPVTQAPKVPGASDGGSFNVPGDVNFFPMDKRDNVAAVNTRGQPLFTAKGGERIDITPQQKVKDSLGPTGTNFGSEMDALRQEMMAALSSAGRPEQPQNIKVSQPAPTSSSFTDDLNKQIARNPYNNPAFERAMIRTRMQESGDPLNDHFSFGNTNY